jgi:hypothetical protein
VSRVTCHVSRVTCDVCVLGEVELVALEENVTRALQLVRQARIEGRTPRAHISAVVSLRLSCDPF